MTQGPNYPDPAQCPKCLLWFTPGVMHDNGTCPHCFDLQHLDAAAREEIRLTRKALTVLLQLAQNYPPPKRRKPF